MENQGRIFQILFKLRFLVAVVAVVSAALIRHAIVTTGDTETPYIFLFLAVVLSAVIGGRSPGLLATFLGVVVASFFFLEPFYSFAITSTSDQIHTAAFAVEGIIISVLCGQLFLAKKIAIDKAANLSLAQQEITLAKMAAEDANLAKSAFLANMSHEIRTPLGALMGFSDLVVDPETLPSEKANFVAAIRRNGDLLSNIINDILDLSKVEAGKLQTDIHEVPLHEILTDIQTLVNLQASENGIELNISVGKNVPQIITTDPLRLRQVLINIIGNAVKFTAKGSVDVEVKCIFAADGHEKLAFIVTDTGKGIAPDQVGRLFSAFTQTDDTTKRKYGGTGLGLVLAKRLTNLLGGDTVLTHSELGKGSTFTVTIDPGPDYIRSAPAAVTAAVSSQRRLDGVQVLLTDDSPDNRILVGRMLKLAGADVDLAVNGVEAVEKARQGNYNVILMDLQMPVMDGYEATAELRRDGYDGKIIALTAHALAEEKRRCLKSGFDDHISKPINRNTLLERVDLLSKCVST